MEHKNYFTRMLYGELGLVNTSYYWGWLVFLISFMYIHFFVDMMFYSVAGFIYLLVAIYTPFLLMGQFMATRKYEGWRGNKIISYLYIFIMTCTYFVYLDSSAILEPDHKHSHTKHQSFFKSEETAGEAAPTNN